MKTPLFVILGVIEPDSDADIGVLKARMETALSGAPKIKRIELKDELLIIELYHPRFPYYITFVKNDAETVGHYKNLAYNFEVPWDVQPVDEVRLTDICAQLEGKGWDESKHHFEIAFTVLKEMKRFRSVTVFTIPSMPKLSFS